MNDRLVILPDDNRDGVADRAVTFAKVHNPTDFEFWNGGVIVASAPDILFLKDTDGDDVADVRIRLFGSIDSSDTHHAANNFSMVLMVARIFKAAYFWSIMSKRRG